MTQKEFLKKTRLSQSEIAALIGVSQSTVSNIENGYRLLTVDQYAKISGHPAGEEYLKMKREFEKGYVSRELIDHSSDVMVYFYKKLKKVIAFDKMIDVVYEDVATDRAEAIEKWNQFK